MCQPLSLLRCGCGKSSMLEDGGHRITAAYKVYQVTGEDILVGIREHVSDFR